MGRNSSAARTTFLACVLSTLALVMVAPHDALGGRADGVGGYKVTVEGNDRGATDLRAAARVFFQSVIFFAVQRW